jgi:iduronate 2-sulfatase
MASISFTDEQFGKILSAVDELGMADNTMVLFTGDHGQNLGEHATWCKMTAWEHSLRVPLVISVPWMPASHGKTLSVSVSLSLCLSVSLSPSLSVSLSLTQSL